MRCGFVYLTVVRDWASRRVLAWRLSTGLAADAAVEALEEAIARHGVQEVHSRPTLPGVKVCKILGPRLWPRSRFRYDWPQGSMGHAT
jgi:transposase InsO family protein